MNEIIFNPTTQYVNTGDLLINKAFVGLLRSQGKLLIDDINKPKWFIDELLNEDDIRLSQFTNRDSINYLIKKLIYNKLKGINTGTRYYYVFVPGHLARKGLKAILPSLKLFCKLFLLKIFGCRLIRTGISLGNFDAGNAFTEALITRCYYYFAVRDKVSVSNASKYRFKSPDYFPDFGWAYQHQYPTIVREPYVASDDKFIVMSFRANELGHGIQVNVYNEILHSLKGLLNSGDLAAARIVFSYQVGSDREANFQLYKELSKDFVNITFFDTKLLLDNGVDMYSRAELVITNRLHVMLLALQADTIAFSLIDEKVNSKIYNILKDNELLDLMLDIKGDTNTNAHKISSVLKSQKTTKDKIRVVRDRNKSEIQEKINRIFNSI